MTAVSHRVQEHRGTLTITGRFDFNIHRDFRQNYEQLLGTPGLREIAVDLARVDYIDSSALGMLLLLRERAAGQNIRVDLVNPAESVRQVLEVANFGRLFQIS